MSTQSTFYIWGSIFCSRALQLKEPRIKPLTLLSAHHPLYLLSRTCPYEEHEETGTPATKQFWSLGFEIIQDLCRSQFPYLILAGHHCSECIPDAAETCSECQLVVHVVSACTLSSLCCKYSWRGQSLLISMGCSCFFSSGFLQDREYSSWILN